MTEFPFAPSGSIPHSWAPREVLLILSDGKAHPKSDLLIVIGDDPRSPLQSLGSETHRFWKIDNVSAGGKGIYQLDPRHLSGCPKADSKARRERMRQLSERSLKQAQRESARLPAAIKTDIKARSEDQQGFDFNNVESAPTATNDQGHDQAGQSLDLDQSTTTPALIISNNGGVAKL
ncbi:MAG: hypothetical protein ACKVJE_21970 [Pseudomonadales bacterium]